MKPVRSAIAVLVAGTLLTACAYLPPADTPARRVSQDYTATGGTSDARAFLYGQHTVLEFNSAPIHLLVKDESGASIEYEREGRYFRLSRKLDNFTAWVNGRAMTFAPIKPQQAAQPPATDSVAAVEAMKLVALYGGAAPAPLNPDTDALLALSKKQLEDVRQVIAEASQNPAVTGTELYEANARLDQIEAQLVAAASAIVQVTFPTRSTKFKPSPSVAETLLSAAKAADSVNVRGRTDARIAGPADPRIALGRALAARKFLIDGGVKPAKIKVFSQADGDFIAPNTTKEGRALNRRVEIEAVNRRAAPQLARLKNNLG